MKSSSQNYNPVAAVVLAAASLELFPGTQVIAGEGTATYFFYDLVFPFEFKAEFLPMLEERVRLILREKRPVRMMEMLPSNAADLMRHQKQRIAAERLMQIDAATVQMVQYGEFALYCPQGDFQEVPVFQVKLLEAEQAGSGIVRIFGAAAAEKDVLKAIAKMPLPSTRSHLKSGFFQPRSEGEWYWSPKGEELRRRWVSLWHEECAKENFNFIDSSVATEGELLESHCHYFLRYGAAKIAQLSWLENEEYTDSSQGLFSPKSFYGDRIHLFCPHEKLLEECISSLRFILKIPRILGFEFEIVLSISSEEQAVLQRALDKMGLTYATEERSRAGVLSSVDVRMRDALGRSWIGPFVRVPDIALPAGKGAMLALSVFGSMERMCALHFETEQGKGDWKL